MIDLLDYLFSNCRVLKNQLNNFTNADFFEAQFVPNWGEVPGIWASLVP